MSHTVQVTTELKDMQILKKVCDKRQIPIEVAAKGQTISRQLYTNTVKGHAAFRLPGWKYDVVVIDDKGTTKFDNFNGSWGKQEEFDSLFQGYSREVVTQKLRQQGFRLQSEQGKVEQDGTLELMFVQ